MQLIAIVHENSVTAGEWALGLSAAGFRVVTSASFDEGKAMLDGDTPPALLIASVRLGAYNGLHLVIRGRLDRPDMTAILTSDATDPTLAMEAANYGAIYLPGPVDRDALVARALEALAGTAV